MTQKLLIDSCGEFVALSLTEDSASGRVIARGEFARGDFPTENKRIYGQHLWEREVSRLGPDIQENKVFGELDHPSDGKTKLSRTSHLISSLEIKDGRVIGAATVMPTEQGKTLLAILNAGGKVGISSRGFGSTAPDGKGNEVVGEDYRLMTFDFVADPANRTSYPDFATESISMSKAPSEERSLKENIMVKEKGSDGFTVLSVEDREIVLEHTKRLVDAARAEGKEEGKRLGKEEADTDMREAFESKMLAKLPALKAEAIEKAKSDLMSDPEVAGAKVALDKIKSVLQPFLLPEDADGVIEKKDSKILELKQELEAAKNEAREIKKNFEELEKVARQVGYALHMEHLISSDADREEIRSVLKGSVFEDKDDVEKRIHDIRSKTAKRREEQVEKDKLGKENAKMVEELQGKLEQSLMASKKFALKAYLEQRINADPQASRIRDLAEQRAFESEGEVDSFLSKFKSENPLSEEFTTVRRRMSRGPSPRVTLEEGDENQVQRRSGNGASEIHGAQMAEIRALSGIV